MRGKTSNYESNSWIDRQFFHKIRAQVDEEKGAVYYLDGPDVSHQDCFVIANREAVKQSTLE